MSLLISTLWSEMTACGSQRAGEPIRDWHRGNVPPSVAYRPPIYTAAEYNVRSRTRLNGDIHVQEAQNAVMIEQDHLMDRIALGHVLLSDSDDDVICAPHRLCRPFALGHHV
jgi:hypothetical protein